MLRVKVLRLFFAIILFIVHRKQQATSPPPLPPVALSMDRRSVSRQRLLVVVVVSMERRSVTQQRALCRCFHRGGKARLADKSFSRPPVVSSAAVQALVATCTSNYNHQSSLPNDCADEISKFSLKKRARDCEGSCSSRRRTNNKSSLTTALSIRRTSVSSLHGCSRTAQDQAVRRSDDAKLLQS